MYTVTDHIHEPLYVVTTVFNSPRFKTRYKLYQRFAKYVKDSGGVLVTVEAAFGERHHAMQESKDQHGQLIYGRAPTKNTEFHKARSENPHQYIRVRTDHEIWIKENLLNIGISRLPEDWKYVAWVDADVVFARPNWVGETIHQLQHYKLVQMFSEAQDLDPGQGTTTNNRAMGFMACFLKGLEKTRNPGHYYYGGVKGGPIFWHPGFAWAARREAIDELGGLIDWAIMGAGDNHMAHALIGEVDQSMHPSVEGPYREKLREWQYRCDKHIRRNVGFVEGLLLHYWHGKKIDRRYWERWKILVNNHFNPDLDLKYDSQGVLQLTDRGDARSIELRDKIRAYFELRNEDSIDL